MKSKSILKSRGRFGRKCPTSTGQSEAHAMIRRRAWRCVRPVLREPDYKVLRQLERIDLRELREIAEEASNGLDHEDNAGENGQKTPVEERRDRLHQLTWLHYMGDLFGAPNQISILLLRRAWRSSNGC
jgi:hypothetical protein